MITENLSTLKIHKLTQAQYDREFAVGNIDANALYLTPDEATNIEIDTTLTQSGMAADSKAIGNALSELEEKLSNSVASLTADKIGARPNTWMPTASEVGADASGTASSLISAHNTATDSHSDIREAISNKLNSSELPTAINTALAQAKANGEFDGKDGTSVTVKSVSESTADGGSNVVTFSDGKTLTIKNGSKGSTGATGVTGPAGPAGKTPIKGTDYWTEDDQETIIQRVLTELGAIPVFGMVDENNNIILTAVLADGTYQLKYADADGNVTDICTYNHNYTPAPDVPDIPTPTYTNVLPLAKGEDGNPYNGTGYAVGKRINSSWNETNVSVTAATNPVFLTGRIPIPAGATVRFKNCYIDTNGVNGSVNEAADKAYYGHGLAGLYGCMLYYNATSGVGNKAGTNYTWDKFVSYSNLASTPTVDSNGYVTEFTFNTTETLYARFVLGGDPTTAIITINEPITD